MSADMTITNSSRVERFIIDMDNISFIRVKIYNSKSKSTKIMWKYLDGQKVSRKFGQLLEDKFNEINRSKSIIYG